MYQYFNYNNNFVPLQCEIIILYHCDVIYDKATIPSIIISLDTILLQ